jgi:hypothetical protein
MVHPIEALPVCIPYGMSTYSDHKNQLWTDIRVLCLVQQLLTFGWFIFSKFKMANIIFS